MRASFWLAAALLALAGAAFLAACAGDDDDDDDRGDFYCGKDFDCHANYFDCLLTCDTWECLDAQCLPAYRDCLTDDGCTQRLLDCLDAAGDDGEAIAHCNDGFGDCLVDYCHGDAECAGECLTTFDECAGGCGLQIGCYAGCLAAQWDCVEGCFPH